MPSDKKTSELTQLLIQGVGAKSATEAHVAEQVPSAALHARAAAGAAGDAMTVPNIKPAPA